MQLVTYYCSLIDQLLRKVGDLDLVEAIALATKAAKGQEAPSEEEADEYDDVPSGSEDSEKDVGDENGVAT